MSPILFRNFVAHVLVLERVMATVWARTYEKRRGAAFSCCWFLIVVSFLLPVFGLNEEKSKEFFITK
jgi:hypothetical protein